MKIPSWFVREINRYFIPSLGRPATDTELRFLWLPYSNEREFDRTIARLLKDEAMKQLMWWKAPERP